MINPGLLRFYLVIASLYFIGSVLTAVVMVVDGELESVLDCLISLFTLICLLFIPIACSGLLNGKTYLNKIAWQLVLTGNVIGFVWGSYEVFTAQGRDLSEGLVIWLVSVAFFVPAFVVIHSYIKSRFSAISVAA